MSDSWCPMVHRAFYFARKCEHMERVEEMSEAVIKKQDDMIASLKEQLRIQKGLTKAQEMRVNHLADLLRHRRF